MEAWKFAGMEEAGGIAKVDLGKGYDTGKVEEKHSGVREGTRIKQEIIGSYLCMAYKIYERNRLEKEVEEKCMIPES